MLGAKVCLIWGAGSGGVQGGCPQKRLGRDLGGLAVEDTECYFRIWGGWLFFFFFLLKEEARNILFSVSIYK